MVVANVSRVQRLEDSCESSGRFVPIALTTPVHPTLGRFVPIGGMTRVRRSDDFKAIPRQGLGHVAVGLLPTEQSREKTPYPARGCGIGTSAHTHEPGIP